MIIIVEIFTILLILVGLSNCFNTNLNRFRKFSRNYKDIDKYYSSLNDNSREENSNYFREYVKRGLQRFMDGNITDSATDLDKAVMFDQNQPLPQRGIIHYCLGNFELAQIQLSGDIIKLEKMKAFKATELRFWHSASLNKLGQFVKAKEAIDINNLLDLPVRTQSYFTNCTSLFYHGDISIENMLEIIGESDKNELEFFGNFFIGLYYDSFGENDLAQAFLSVAVQRNKNPKNDMWHYLPRVLYHQRYGDGDTTSTESGSNVNAAGMIF
eukprot:gene6464-8893_t